MYMHICMHVYIYIYAYAYLHHYITNPPPNNARAREQIHAHT